MATDRAGARRPRPPRSSACRRCPRLVAWREASARREGPARFADEPYWGRPLPGFGDPDARILIVGLAPAAHGGNRTGRVFTGDASGRLPVAGPAPRGPRGPPVVATVGRRPDPDRHVHRGRGPLRAARQQARRSTSATRAPPFLARELGLLRGAPGDRGARRVRLGRARCGSWPRAGHVPARRPAVRAPCRGDASDRTRSSARTTRQPAEHVHRAADAGDVRRRPRAGAVLTAAGAPLS